MAIELIAKIKPKNNGTFPMVDAVDVEMPDGSRLSDFKGGVSPSISVTPIDGGHRVTITDADGTKTFDVLNGTGGEGGVNNEFVTDEEVLQMIKDVFG